MPVPAATPRRLARRTFAALAVWAVVGAAAAALLAHGQAGSRQDAEQRFALRATIASRFVTTYLRDLADRQVVAAKRHLTRSSVSQRRFTTTVRDSEFSAALLLDREGRILRTVPRDRAVIGDEPATRYPHLEASLAGRVAISGVVPSVVERRPVIALAVPFDTASGRRVFNGAYDIATTPAGAYLRNAIPIPSSRLYLVDATGAVIARNGATPIGVQDLADVEPGLGDDASGAGGFTARGRAQRYATADIAGTPWRIVVTAPASALYESSADAARWLPWAALAGFVLVSLFAVLVFLRYLRGRDDLACLVTRLEEVVRVDAVTGLYNRRGIEEQLSRAVGQARRRDHPLTVMLIDVDHFKRVNDTWGHQAGDLILAALAGLMRDALRTEDALGRWGGEEFLAVLPDTSNAEASRLAERLRTRIAAARLELPDGSAVPITVSIGLTSGTDGAPEERIGRADQALYAAKSAGRNRVERAPGPPLASAGRQRSRA